MSVGCRKLTKQEVQAVLTFGFLGKYAVRNKMLFYFLIRTGVRLQEALSTTIQELQNAQGEIRDSFILLKSNTKNRETRLVRIPPDLRVALTNYIQNHTHEDQVSLFEAGIESINHGEAICARHGMRILRKAFLEAGVDDFRLGSHCCRKTFAFDVYEDSNYDWEFTRKALGHNSIKSTQHYLEADDEKVNAVIDKDRGYDVGL